MKNCYCIPVPAAPRRGLNLPQLLSLLGSHLLRFCALLFLPSAAEQAAGEPRMTASQWMAGVLRTAANPQMAGILRTAANPRMTGILRTAATPWMAGTLQTAANQRTAANQQAEKFLSLYGNAILRLAYSYVHNKEDAEDILQETLIRVLKANPAFENEAHEKAYLLRTAANLAKNRIAYNRGHRTDELNEELIAEEREDLSFVWEAVKSLPETSREVLHLFYYEGLPTAVIAGILGRKEATVRSDLMRGRERLRKLLKEEYDFE